MKGPEEDFVFHQAIRQNVGLFIGFAGGTGSGKTYTMLRMAAGIVGPGNAFAVIDTENKRASHYADEFNFKVFDFAPPYSSVRYEGAVRAAFNAGYKAIVVDSVSHEHDGYDGYLDSQSKDLEERVKRYKEKHPGESEYKAMEKLTPSSWVQPKLARKRMMQTFLACSSTVPILFGFRAEEKSFMSKDGKLVSRPTPEWEPICGKGMPFEMTVFFMLHKEKPGQIGTVIKLPDKLKHIFPMGKQLGEESGKLISEWAKGSTIPQEPSKPSPDHSPVQPEKTPPAATSKVRTDSAVRCPNHDNKWKPISLCDPCPTRQGCPSW